MPSTESPARSEVSSAASIAASEGTMASARANSRAVTAKSRAWKARVPRSYAARASSAGAEARAVVMGANPAKQRQRRRNADAPSDAPESLRRARPSWSTSVDATAISGSPARSRRSGTKTRPRSGSAELAAQARLCPVGQPRLGPRTSRLRDSPINPAGSALATDLQQPSGGRLRSEDTNGSDGNARWPGSDD